MAGFLRLLQITIIAGALVGGGRALYRNRDKVKEVWESFGAAEGESGFHVSASELAGYIGPVTGFVRQMAALKK
jgi:hypothetical protein